MVTLSRIGIIVFALTVLFGPVFTVKEYSVISNLISELGAQHTKNNFLMIGAFLVLGGLISGDGIRKFRWSNFPFVLFGVFMAVVGLFPHRPLDPSLEYNQLFHDLHGIMASVAGTSLTIGFIWKGFLERNLRERIICFYLALVAIFYPILMLSFPDYQGILQRFMYLQILAWMWFKFPTNARIKI